MLDTILSNEFNRITGQDMSDYELTALKDYIDYYWEMDWTTTDIRVAVNDFVAECYTQNTDYNELCAGAPEYTINDWWTFPFAAREYHPDRTVITYRGGTTTEYL